MKTKWKIDRTFKKKICQNILKNVQSFNNSPTE